MFVNRFFIATAFRQACIFFRTSKKDTPGIANALKTPQKHPSQIKQNRILQDL